MNSSACVETDFQDSKLRDQTLGGKLAGERGNGKDATLRTVSVHFTPHTGSDGVSPLGERLLSNRTAPHIQDLQLRHRTRSPYLPATAH